MEHLQEPLKFFMYSHLREYISTNLCYSQAIPAFSFWSLAVCKN